MKRNIRILVVIPVTTDQWDPVMSRLCEQVKSPTTDLTVAHLDEGVAELESSVDIARVSGPLLDYLEKNIESFDGVIVDCYSDPAVSAARELLQKPVLGVGEAAEYLACAVGHRIGIVASSERTWRHIKEQARIRGTADRIAAIRCWGASPLGLMDDDEGALRFLRTHVEEMHRTAAIDTVIISCGSNLALDRDLSAELGLPLVVPEQAAVKMMEAVLPCRLPVSPAYAHRAVVSAATR